MKTLTLVRVAQALDDGTFGVLIGADDVPLCVTLEDPWKDNAVGVSCIPGRVYICEPYSSTRFTDVWEVLNVTGRTAILFHVGNTTDDTSGCILPGSHFGELNGRPAVLRSRIAFDLLRAYVGTDKPFVLNVVNTRNNLR